MTVDPPTGEARRACLRSEILDGMTNRSADWWRGAFDRLAIAVYRYQCDANPVYGRFARSRGADPEADIAVDEIPAVPSRAFKDLPLMCGDPGGAERVFRTSGTTRSGRAGRHHVRDLSIYRASLLAAAGPMLGIAESPPDLGRTEHIRIKIRVLSLIPDPAERKDSSLAFMVGCWSESWGDAAGGFFADGDWGLDIEGFGQALATASADGVPTLVAGTAFSFVHWLDDSEDDVTPLPPGSLVVETGGFKGRSRELDRPSLYGAIARRLGIPVERIVNEYGMTEMLSQFYEPILDAPPDPTERCHVGPPWVRTTILDPRTLYPVPSGSPGLLCHLDLANLDSVVRILTEDLGVATERGFRLLGRIEGAEPRGCSLAAEALRVAAGEEGTAGEEGAAGPAGAETA